MFVPASVKDGCGIVTGVTVSLDDDDPHRTAVCPMTTLTRQAEYLVEKG